MQLTEKDARAAYRRLTARGDRSKCFSSTELVGLAQGIDDPETRKQVLGHLLRCSECSRELQLAYSLAEWSPDVAAAVSRRRPGSSKAPGAAGGADGVLGAVFTAWGQASLSVRIAVVVLLLLLVGTTATSLNLLLETRKLERDLTVANQVRGRATSIGATLDEANESLVQLRSERARLDQSTAELRDEIARITSPFANQPIITLDLRRVDRRDGVLPRQTVPVPADARWFTLLVTLGAPLGDAPYALEVLNMGAEMIWETRDLLPDARGTFTLTFPTRLMSRGIFHLRFFGLGDGERRPIEDLSIEITTP